MRIIQLLSALTYGDAVGNNALAISDVIRKMGVETGMYYTGQMDNRFPPETARHYSCMLPLQEEDILIYHACTGDPVNYILPGFGGKKVMIYHNVTPPHFFHPFSSEVKRIQESALEGFRFLADKVDYCIADSEFNRQDLLKMGYRCPIDVCPIVIPFVDYDAEPDQAVMERMKRGGCQNLLFVGRISPNKKQEDIIRAFYDYHRRYQRNSRLILIGSDRGMETYCTALKKYIDRLELRNQVLFPGHIRFSEVLAYYRTADAFVCMSEHEGFCVPLVEAMYFGLPIVAYKAGAVAETVGGGALLLDRKEPEYVSAAIHRLITDRNLKSSLGKAQKNVLARFSHEKTEQAVAACIRKAMAM